MRRSSSVTVADVEQVGAALERPAQCLAPPPAVDLAVMPREQDRRHGQVPEGLGSRVLRVLEQARCERVALVRRLGDHARHEPHDGIDEDERRQLPAGEHVVADADLAVDERPDPLVDSLVATADECEVRQRCQLARQRIGEPLAGRDPSG